MLKLFSYDVYGAVALGSCIAILDEASNVKVTCEINGEYLLEFDFPRGSDKTDKIKENYIVVCEGQNYRIMKVSHEADKVHVSCVHIFHADLKKVHVQTFGGTADTIGANPSYVLSLALLGTSFFVFSDAELADMGMVSVGSDGFKIDFEAVDKTNPYDIIQQIITNCGKGELYIDNYRIALVERIGADSGVRLSVSGNLQNVTIERDISNMITRLYPYGKDDVHIGSVNSGVQYIESENARVYGVKSGHRDYSDYGEPSDIIAHAQWEFSPDNEQRIDVPEISISGAFIDLAKLCGNEIFEVKLGDRVRVIDRGNEFSERVIKLERYPYEPETTSVTIGRVKKDLFFYLNQLGRSARYSNKNLTSNGRINARALSGSVVTSGVYEGSQSVNVTGLCQIGTINGAYVFDVFDASGSSKVLNVSSSGLNVSAVSVSIGGAVLKVVDGVLYVNNTKIADV